MTDMPVVTVVTPSYNQGKFIEQTIKSVLTQDYPDVEYIVIDGGSTDNTLEVLKKYSGRLDWISEPDEGQTNAINKGFKKAKGDILCWLNSDDTYEPGAIRRAVEFFIDNPDVMMVYGEGNEIDENGALIQRFPATREFDLWALVYIWDYILQPTTFFRKSVFDEIGMLNEDYYWCMDWDLWIRIGSRFK
ncbi:MAG: glycosyltransferase, partial [Deltaproteobacteria bacterium]|nr:glycosyltransferase [Deltaproteobacteria bacterium]